MICSGGISNRNGKITEITRISTDFKWLQVPFSFSKYRSHSAGTVLWLIFWWAGTFSSNSHCRSLYRGPANASYSLTGVSYDSAGIPKRFYALFYPCAHSVDASFMRCRLNRRKLNTYRETRPPSWENGTWQVPSQLSHSEKGGRTVALVVQGWHIGRSDIAMDAMVAVKFWACSKQSHKGRRGGRSLTGRSKEAGHRRGRRMDAQWSAIGRPVKKCEHCVSIWATRLPSLYHHCASFGRPMASIERSLWRPLCLHSATTSTLEPSWQWFCLHSAFFARPVVPLQQLWSFKEGTRVVLQQLHRNRTFWVPATTERPNHFYGRTKVARRSQPCVKGALHGLA